MTSSMGIKGFRFGLGACACVAAGLMVLSLEGAEAAETSERAAGQPRNVQQIGTVSFDQLSSAAPAPDELDAIESSILEKIFDWICRQMQAYIRYDVELVKITYDTTTSKGETITVTGLVVIPVSTNHTMALPLIAFQHPTLAERNKAPSAYSTNSVFSDPQLSTPVAVMMAMSGYIVALADYPGLGDNTNAHPYCQLSLANSVVDIIGATLDLLPAETRYPEWDERLYLTGFSEGGYATMVTARQIQENPEAGLTVAAVAPLDGPYSLSDTMRDVILYSDTNFVAPYFLPLVLVGYDSVYAEENPLFAFTNAVVSSVPSDPDFAVNLYNMTFAATNTGNEISDYVRKAEPYLGPASILTEEFRNGLADTNSDIIATLRANDAFRGWKPEMPMALFHNYYDDLVPYGNSTNAYIAFEAAGATNVSMIKFGTGVDGLLIALLKQAAGSMHAASAPFAYVFGFQWLDSIAYPDRETGNSPVVGDVLGDGLSDLIVYDSNTGLLYFLVGGETMTFSLGAGVGELGIMPLAADFDGDGTADIAAYHEPTGFWSIMLSGDNYSVSQMQFGGPGYQPMAADFDGDGKADAALYHGQSGYWFILKSSDHSIVSMKFGEQGYQPVIEDFDGDGKADPALYHEQSGYWYIFRSSDYALLGMKFGEQGYQPVAGDFEGDGRADPAVYHESSGYWYILRSSDYAVLGMKFGEQGYQPVTGDFDGDGKTDPALYHEESGFWYVLLSNSGYALAAQQMGGPGSTPVIW